MRPDHTPLGSKGRWLRYVIVPDGLSRQKELEKPDIHILIIAEFKNVRSSTARTIANGEKAPSLGKWCVETLSRGRG